MSSSIYLGPAIFAGVAGLFVLALAAANARARRRARRTGEEVGTMSLLEYLPLIVAIAAGQLALNAARPRLGDVVVAALVAIYIAGVAISVIRAKRA
jgi:hypothetical protein